MEDQYLKSPDINKTFYLEVFKIKNKKKICIKKYQRN